MAEHTSILIADDHPLFRAGLRQALEKGSGLRIIAEVENGEDALAVLVNQKPDVAVLDIQMPRLTGLEIAKRAEHIGLETRIILLTMLDDKKIFLDAMESGVKGYVLKDGAVSEIRSAIATVIGGKHYISPSLSGLLVERRRGGPATPELSSLTAAELGVMKLIAELKSNQEIADDLLISKRTVENHRVNISKKLNLTGSNAILRFALKHKDEL